jgi:radical SAM superfamily enzyme YgiQ (UPF0313 family)
MRGLGKFNEVNVFKPVGRGVKIGLLYPSTYQASITNLFTHTAYFYLYENLQNVLVDRFTLDNPERGALSDIPLNKFDLILASIGYELDLLTVARMLKINQIPILRELRSDKNYPILIAGGPPLMANPIPASVIFDYVYVGEGEVLLQEMVKIISELGRRPDRKLITRRIKEIEANKAVYFLGKDDVRRVHSIDYDNAYIPSRLIKSLDTSPVYGKGYYIEISRGCKWLCPFCMEAYVTYPPRHRRLTKIMEAIRSGTKEESPRRAVFYALSFFDHPQADKLLEQLLEEGIKYSLPSIRYHTLNQKRIELIREGGQRTITLAPETGVATTANLIRKKLDKELLLMIAEKAKELNMQIKLYFIFGLPAEGKEAGEEAGNLVQYIARKAQLKKGSIKISVNPLIPKAWTPMQYCSMISKEEFTEKVRMFRKVVSDYVSEVSVYDWKLAYIQALLSRGDVEVGKAIWKWSEHGSGIRSFSRFIQMLGRNYFLNPFKGISWEDAPWRVVNDRNAHLIKSIGERICTC